MSNRTRTIEEKSNDLPLSDELITLLKSGQTHFQLDDGDWEIDVQEAEKTDYRIALPDKALIIAGNGCGDCLFVTRESNGAETDFSPEVLIYWHDENRYEVYAESLIQLTTPKNPVLSEYHSVYYSGGKTEIKLGDTVVNRGFFRHRSARIVYIPGKSRKNRNMEHDGLAWIGIRLDNGSISGALIDPRTRQIGKKILFVERSSAPFQELSDIDFT